MLGEAASSAAVGSKLNEASAAGVEESAAEESAVVGVRRGA